MINSESRSASSDLLSSCWLALLQLKEKLHAWKGPVRYCSLRFGDNEAVEINSAIDEHPGCFHVTLEVEGAGETRRRDEARFRVAGFAELEEIDGKNLPPEVLLFVKLYGPYCFASSQAKHLGRSVAITHFAQSLDGRIATAGGGSKWIGDRKNREHAHRMRALCDGVLVGAGTVRRDRPRLTVRHVPGRNPVRIVLGSSQKELRAMTDASSEPVWVIGGKRETLKGNVHILDIEEGENGLIPAGAILKELHGRRIDSVYIEGGGMTASHFLKSYAVDVLQLHISPLILGSGRASFSLPVIEKISEARRFDTHEWFQVGDGVMFVGSFHPRGDGGPG